MDKSGRGCSADASGGAGGDDDDDDDDDDEDDGGGGDGGGRTGTNKNVHWPLHQQSWLPVLT